MPVPPTGCAPRTPFGTPARSLLRQLLAYRERLGVAWMRPLEEEEIAALATLADLTPHKAEAANVAAAVAENKVQTFRAIAMLHDPSQWPARRCATTQ